MSHNLNKISKFWQELKRRKVVRVITVYAAAAFVILELVDIVAPSLRLPEWTMNFIIVLLCVGFIIAVILSWIFDVTPEGIEKTKPSKEVRKDEKSVTPNSWKIATYVSVFIIIGLVGYHILSDSKSSRDIRKLEKTIAVLPFENWHSDEEFPHLGDAIANEINTQLAKINQFHVFSFTSSSKFKGPDKPSIPQIGRELGANFIIEGSVERQDQDVSIHVQVIQAHSDNHLWANEFKGKWKDLFTIRAEIAINIAEKLKTVLSPEELKQIEKKHTDNLEAYNLYLKGRWFWNKWTDTDIKKGMDYFKQALEMDPGFALAYAGFAEAYNTLSFYGQLHPEDTYPKAKDLALKALEIDNSLAEAHNALAFVKVYYDWDWEGGEQEFKEAIALDPDYITAHHLYAYFLVLQARFDEALKEINKALSLDPFNLIINRTLGDFYYHMREYNKAEQQLKKTLEMNSAFNLTHAYLGLVYLQQSLCKKALEELQEEINLDHGPNDILAWQGYVYSVCGYKDEGYQILNDLLESSENRYIPPSYFTWIYFALGEYEQGFEWLNKAYIERDPWLTEIKISHFYDGIRSEPRYIELLEKMKLNK